MKRLAVVSVLTLAACASEPPVVTAQPGVAPGGNWVVVRDYAAETVAVATSPYMGQVVTLDQTRVVDPAGRLCKAPAYHESEGDGTEALGDGAQPGTMQNTSPRKIVTITCDDEPFGTFVAQPDGTWLTRMNSWVLTLAKEVPKPVEPAAEPPKPEPAPVAAMPEPAPAPAPVTAKPVAAKPDARTLVYLASYKTEASAKKGFKVLAKASPILAKQQPVTQTIDLGKKGQWVRLYGLAANEAERTKICGQLGKRVDECGARNRE